MQATWRDDAVGDDVRDGWRDLLFSLLDMLLPEAPALIPPSDAAMRLWADAHDRMERERHAEPDDRMRAARAKLIGAIPRLALILQCVSAATGEKNATVRFIDEASMTRAVELAEWFTRETRRVYSLLTDDAGEDDILARIRENGNSVSVRDLMRWSREFRTAALAESFLDSLVKDGVGRWVWARQTGRGQPRRTFILLTGADADTNQSHGSKNGDSVSVSAVSGDKKEPLIDPDDRLEREAFQTPGM